MDVVMYKWRACVQCKMIDVLIGTLCSLCGNACISASYLMQKAAHQGRAQGNRRVYLTPLWIIGFFLMGPGELGNVLALKFVQTRLVAGLGSATVCFNALGSAKWLEERMTRLNYVGAGMCAVSGVMFVFATNSNPPFESVAQLKEQLQSNKFLLYAFVLLAISFFTSLSTNLASVVMSMGVYGAACLLTTNCSVHLFRIVGVADTREYGYVQWWLAAIALVFIVLQCIFFQKALAHHPVSHFIPAHYCVYNALSVAGAALLYDSFGSGTHVWQVVLYSIGICTACVGVVLVISGPKRYAVVDEPEKSIKPDREILLTPRHADC